MPLAGSEEWYEVHGTELRTLEPRGVATLGLLEATDLDQDESKKLVSVKTVRHSGRCQGEARRHSRIKTAFIEIQRELYEG